MGLDNGFIVCSSRRPITRNILPAGIKYPFDGEYSNDAEIIYHRKDWGWRGSIMEHFRWREDISEPYTIDTPEQVIELIELTASWLDEEKWEEDGHSIWGYENARRHLIEDLMNFTLIYGFMLQNPDIYLEFYDSY